MSKLTYSVEVQLWTGSAYSITWTDITADVITSGFSCFSGTRGTAMTDRVSDVGECTFDLNNSESNSAKLAGYYSPGHTNARAGFDKGCPLRVRFTFEGITRTKWYGRIYDYLPEPGTRLTRRTHITAYDWMYQANKYTLSLPSYEINKRMDEALPMVAYAVPLPPLSVDFAVCPDPFPTVFDNMNYKTTAMAEFQKLAQSEIGNIFLNHNLAGDEILASTGRWGRSSATPVSHNLYTLPNSSAGALLNNNGSKILNNNGSYLLLGQTAEIAFADSQTELGNTYGSQQANHVVAATNPRTIGANPVVLFTQTEPVFVPAGYTVEFYKVIYKDPSLRAIAVCGKDIIPVVATTDYLFNTASDGSGTNITSDLAISAIYSADNTEFSFTNNNASDGYITFLQVRGTPIYVYDKVTRIAEDAASIARYGLCEFTYDLPYQPPPFTAYYIAQVILAQFADPSSFVGSVTYAPTTDDAIQKFLAIDCNTYINVSETQTAIDDYFFVQGWNLDILGNNDTTGLVIRETLYLYKKEFISPDMHPYDYY